MPGKLDEFHYHEALDRTHVARYNFNENVSSHQVIAEDAQLQYLAYLADESLDNLYQAIGQKAYRLFKENK